MRLFLGRISREVRESDIETLVTKYGETKFISLKQGFGFVEFADPKDAQDCLEALNGTEFFGERIVVEEAKGDRRPPRDRDDRGFDRRDDRGFDRRDDRGFDRRDDRGFDRRDDRGGRFERSSRFSGKKYRALVKNVPRSVSWQDLKDHMRKAGEVVYADVHKKREGEGIVDYATPEDLKEALRSLDNSEIEGSRIIVEEFPERSGSPRRFSRSPPPRRRSPPRRYSRSPPRRRSRSPKRDSRSPPPRRQSPPRDAAFAGGW